MSSARPSSQTWTSRRRLAWAVRVSTVLVPLLVAVGVMVAFSRVVARPKDSLLSLGWYALLLAISYGASWATGKVMDRSLPLATLLEMSLTFPESAPSRLGMAQRGGSAAALTRLATAPPDESTQAAAERILKLLTALAAHDRFTRGHAERVRAYTDLIASNMNLTEGDRDRLRWAALLHDIGKLRVPSGLLNKPGKPTPLEWDQLKAHPVQGSVIAAPLLAWLRPMDRVIAEHHEKFDGTGYPVGLSGEQISQGARIVTVADSFEAMTAVRSYNKPMKREAALAELVRCAGTHFDPVVVRALLAVPHRRLLWAMGPTAWLAGLPWVGQGSLGAIRAGISHAGTAVLSAGAVAVAAVAPTALFSTAHADPPTQLAAAATTAPALPSAKPSLTTHATPTPKPQTSTPSPTPTKTHAAKPTHPSKTPAATKTPARTPAPTSHTAHLTPVAPTTTPAVATTTASPRTSTAQPTTASTTADPTTAAPTTTRPTTASPTTAAPTTKATKAAATTTAAPTRTTAPPTVVPTPAVTVVPTTLPPTTAAPTTAAPTTTPAGAALACTAAYTPTAAHKASITVTSTGTAISTGWTVTWTWTTGDPKVKSAVGASVSQSSKTVTARNGLLNGILLPGANTTFTVSGDGNMTSPIPALSCVEH